MVAGQGLTGAPPRIYTLFGSVARDASHRAGHLSRIAGLGFDWVCWSDLSAKRDNAKLAQLVREAEAANLKLMLETASTDTAGFIEALRAGVSGFLATAAGDHAASDWRRILEAVRAEVPAAVFAGEALGRPWEETLGIAASGFDYMINSAAWWDLRQAWFLRQQYALSGLVATLASPEPLHGSRLAHRLMNVRPDDRKAIFRAHYLLASVVSSGIICPMGYEVASAATFDGAAHADGDWDAAKAQAPFDLSDDIARINRLKASAPVLAGEGRLRLASAPGARRARARKDIRGGARRGSLPSRQRDERRARSTPAGRARDRARLRPCSRCIQRRTRCSECSCATRVAPSLRKRAATAR